MQTIADHATLWLDAGLPVRLFWREERWRVSDTPTPLFAEVDYCPPNITHPGKTRIGWRFQATNAAGASRVFDVVRDGEGWLVVHSYD